MCVSEYKTGPLKQGKKIHEVYTTFPRVKLYVQVLLNDPNINLNSLYVQKPL